MTLTAMESNGGTPGVTVAGTRIAINVHYATKETSFVENQTSFVENQSSSPDVPDAMANGQVSPSASTIRSKSTGSPSDLASDTSPDAAGGPAAAAAGVALQEDSPYTDGPDQIIPSDQLFTCDKSAAVKLRIGNKGASATPPISVHSYLHRAADRFGGLVALRSKQDGVWHSVTYREYLEQVRCVARAFIKLGLEPHGAVCILGFNAPQWMLSCLGAIYAGGASAGVYTTNNADACRHCAADSRCNIFVVEDAAQLKKVMQFRDRVPSLRVIVQYSGEPTEPGVLSWAQLMDLGAETDNRQLQQRVQRVAVNQLAALIYTSGTTGQPKGVMLSHDNLTYTGQASVAAYGFSPGADHCVSYLPLSHVAALVSDVFTAIAAGACVWFAGKNALKGGLVETLQEVRPTGFLGVPRVFEKIREGFELKSRQTKGLRRSLLDWALSCGRRSQMNRINGNPSKPLGYGLARRLVLNKIHKALGLDRARFLLSGAAPVSKETVAFFHSLDMPLLQVYGMSESTGPHTTTVLSQDKLGTVGTPVQGVNVKLDKLEAGEGEVCMGGRNVFMGYLQLEEKTAEATDADGWLYSGDLGKLDAQGLLSITGRSKELIITAGGENVPPVRIEDEIVKELPIVSNCCLIGDRRKFLAMLLTLKVNVDMETMEPTDQLSPASLDYCAMIGSKSRSVHDVINGPDETLMAAIQAGFDRANSRATSNAQRVQKWTILPKDFSIPSGEIGPTMKLKRPVVHKKFADVIERLYA